MGNFEHGITWSELHIMVSFWLQGRCQKEETEEKCQHVTDILTEQVQQWWKKGELSRLELCFQDFIIKNFLVAEVEFVKKKESIRLLAWQLRKLKNWSL